MFQAAVPSCSRFSTVSLSCAKVQLHRSRHRQLQRRPAATLATVATGRWCRGAVAVTRDRSSRQWHLQLQRWLHRRTARAQRSPWGHPENTQGSPSLRVKSILGFLGFMRDVFSRCDQCKQYYYNLENGSMAPKPNT